MMKHISPEKFVELLKREKGKVMSIIDVREQMEWDYYHLEEAELIPMNTIPARIADIPADRDVYVICAHGVRSQMVCGYLEQNGRDNIINVQGGMAAVAALFGFQYD
jgi:rhodanese-related sulfurtransferase